MVKFSEGSDIYYLTKTVVLREGDWVLIEIKPHYGGGYQIWHQPCNHLLVGIDWCMSCGDHAPETLVALKKWVRM